MSLKNSIFNQTLHIIPRHEYGKICKKSITGLRGIEAALDSIKNMLYHLGVKTIKRSTLSYANSHRPAEIMRV